MLEPGKPPAEKISSFTFDSSFSDFDFFIDIASKKGEFEEERPISLLEKQYDDLVSYITKFSQIDDYHFSSIRHPKLEENLSLAWIENKLAKGRELYDLSPEDVSLYRYRLPKRYQSMSDKKRKEYHYQNKYDYIQLALECIEGEGLPVEYGYSIDETRFPYRFVTYVEVASIQISFHSDQLLTKNPYENEWIGVNSRLNPIQAGEGRWKYNLKARLANKIRQTARRSLTVLERLEDSLQTVIEPPKYDQGYQFLLACHDFDPNIQFH